MAAANSRGRAQGGRGRGAGGAGSSGNGFGGRGGAGSRGRGGNGGGRGSGSNSPRFSSPRTGKAGSYQAGRPGKGKPQGKGAGKGAGRPQELRVSRERLIEGRRAVDEALACDMPITRAFIATTASSQDPKLARMASDFEASGIPVMQVTKAQLDRLSAHGAHQGIMVEVEPFHYLELEELLARVPADEPALIFVLDHVTDEGNFGAIVRSAEVVGAAGVVIPKARSASVGTGAYKTSAGAVLHVPIVQVSNIKTALETLKAAHFWVGAATEHAHDLAWDAPLAGRIALVMGNEETGVSSLVLKNADFSAKLPVRGRVESLNVAQAATAFAYEWLRQTTAAQPSFAAPPACKPGELEAFLGEGINGEVLENLELTDSFTGEEVYVEDVFGQGLEDG